MSFLDSIKHAFEPLKHVAHDFDPHHAAETITNAIHHVKLNHVNVASAVDYIKMAEPSTIQVDLFAGTGFDLVVQLDLEFGMGMTVRNPIRVVGQMAELVSNPPHTVHALCDRLWTIVPEEVHIYEQLQAVVGERVQLGWDGEDVMKHVTEYLNKRGWLEKKLRP